ncbi:hypothetical protein DFH06DRAFT_1128361 [Mycena polygramma]|nr:hypothetical protein DFH06DRAFT_1128361 [Mycena polygramma]
MTQFNGGAELSGSGQTTRYTAYQRETKGPQETFIMEGGPESAVEGETGCMAVKPIAAERGLMSSRPGANDDQADAGNPDLSKIGAQKWAKYRMVEGLTNAKANGSGRAAVASGQRG